MLSRWALKHVFRFILKKKLGKIILGDIDLDQLDVQLGAGSIELHDLALNVEYLNQKLGMNPVMVKDGSIGSLSVKIPWNMSNCEVEIKDLEIVLSPQSVEKVPGAVGHMPSRRIEKPSVSGSPVKIGDIRMHQDAAFTPSDVHEGVKTIANLVKCLLSNFHVKVNNLLVALDPNLKKSGKTSPIQGIMVFRITELAYGTCLSESAQTHSDSGSKTDGFLGLTKLTNFVTFRGATVELLQVTDEESQSDFSGASGLGISQSCKPFVPPIPVFTGENGLCGTLKLSMPWKNGSLDISRVDAEFHIDPVELRFYPSSIQFIIFSWDSFKFLGRNDNGSTNCKAVASETGLSDRLFTNMKSHIGVETSPKESIPGTRLILDWVPVGIAKDKNAGAEVEPDFGASVNQFFDCLDGISSQSALSSSGIWNWTCSVFSTISAASSLASGSLHIPTEQHHVETNINATIAAVSIILSFHDETQNGYNDMKRSGEIMYINNMNSAVESVHLEKQNMLPEQKTCFYSYVHYLEANLQGLNVTFQIFPQEVKFEAVLKQITVNDCFNFEGKATDSGSLVNGDKLFREVNLVHSLQSEIQGSLPPFPFSFQDPPDTLKSVSRLDTAVTNLHLEPVDTKVQGDDHRPISRAKYVKMNILRTSNLSKHLISVISRHANGKIKSSTSFFARLPPIIMWVNLNTVNMLLDLCNQIGETALPNLSGTSDASSHGPQERKGFDKKSGDMANPTVVSVQGNIVLAETRTIVCFPLQRCGDSRNLYFHNNFAVFDLCPSERTDIAGETYHVQNGCSGGSFNYMPSSSIHLNIGSFSVYLISKPDRNTSEGNSFVYNGQAFSAKEIFSSIAGTCGECSGVFMIWKADAVTDMHIAKRAWDMATSRNFSRNSRRKCEFATVATVSDREGISSQVHQELISASGFSFRIHFARAIVNLGHTEYALLVHLISQIMDVFSNSSSEKNDVNTREDLSKDKLKSHDVKFCQSSFLLECDVLVISLKLEEALDANTSIQNELPGSWASARLTVQNFELLSGSNVGGMPSSSILWVSHGEGELWGSIVKTAGEVAGTSEDLMLVCARNSAMRRGDGGGANALSSGFAGTSIMHLSYTDMLQTSTSITLKCGTLVAPGGRLDWLAAISSFFCVPASDGACSSDADGQKNFSQKEKVYESSFFLELLDVGLSYEPYQKGVKVGKEGVKPACPDSMKSTGKIGEQGVACFLAAASLYVSSRNSDGATYNDYKIGIQDIGLLLSDLPALGYLVDYDVRHLHENNYVKVAGETLVEVILKTDLKDGTWQLTCSGCHVKINTCHDTMAGFICLGAQFQQLFAPDITESVLHLQTRWNTVMQANNDRDEAKLFGGDTFTSPLIVQASGIDEGSNSSPLGLMDEILDDVFREEAAQSLSLSESLSNHASSSETVPDNECFLHTSKNGNTPLNASTNLLHQPEEGNLSKSSPNCLPEFIDDYYVLDTFSAQNPGGYHKHSEAGPSSKVTSSASNVDNGKSGWYEDGSFCILENHIPIVNHHEGCIDLANFEHSSTFSSLAEELKRKGRIILENVNVTWAMFAGSDWSSSRCNSSEVSKSGGRDTTKCLELSLLGMNIEYDIFPDGKLNVSNLSVSVQDVHVYDSSKEAPWKMVLGYYHSKLHPRESHAKAVNLILETVKPDPLIPLEEYRLRLSLLPLRLHLHQSQVDFLVSFFSHGHPSSDQFSSIPNDLGRPCTFATSVSQLNVVEEALLPFFQKCDIYPSILRVDYVPQHVDLAALGGGNYVELLNLVPWKGIELRLKYVHAAGIYGWNSVCETVIGEWLEDISHNQVCELIKGLVPVRSLCSVGSGAAKLISLPVANYRKDHKLLKGLQRGAIAFLRSVSLEAVALGVHLAGGAHDMLFQTEYILQNVPRSIHTASRDNGDAAVRVNQPNNAQEGVRQAYKTLAHGFGKSASALVGNPIKSYNRGASAGSALASAAKSAPAAAVAPATAAVGAIHCALLGVRNSLDPERKRESMEKYSGPSESHLHHKPMR